MKTILVLTILASLLLIGAAPPAMAAPDDPQCVIQCDWKEQLVRDLIERLDPRDWPCTCDPMPEPLGP